MANPTIHTSIRLTRQFRKQVAEYQMDRGLNSFSDALVELAERALAMHKSGRVRSKDQRNALHEAMKAMFPAWDGSTPEFGKPMKVSLPNGVDPIAFMVKGGPE